MISVITPVYNCELFIGEMIESILSQTFTDWELLISDDGSTDKTVDIIQSYKDKRIRCFCLPHSSSCEALNNSLALARGNIISRQDADDWSHRERLQLQYEALKDTDIVTCGMTLFKKGKYYPNFVTGMIPDKYFANDSPTGPAAATIMCHKYVYDDVGNFNSDFEATGDSDWNFRVLIRNKYKWKHINKDLYYYRRHVNQMTNTLKDEARRIHHELRLHYAKYV